MSSPKRPIAFVIMPFDQEFDEVYNLFIVESLNKAGFEVIRADDLRSQRSILQDIVSSIISCDLIVADLTGSNSNVFYELGLAHGLKRPVILLTQDLSDIPFDLKPYRVLQYDTHFAKIFKAKTELFELAKGALEGSVPFGSPVTDFEGSKIEISIQQSQSVVSETNTKEVGNDLDERGFLDHVEDMHEGFRDLTEIIKQIGLATEIVNTETQNVTQQIESVLARPSAGSVSYARKLTSGLAEKLIKYTQTLTEANDRYYTVTLKTDNSLEFIVSFQKLATESDKAELKKFLETLIITEQSASQGRAGFAGVIETIKALPKIEKNLDRALLQCSSELGRLIDNIERTIASIKRAREIGLRKLQDSKQN